MNTILVLTDFSKRAEIAARYAVELAKKTESKILLFNSYYVPIVMPIEGGPYSGTFDAIKSQKESLAQLQALALKLTPSPKFPKENADFISYECAAGSLTEKVKDILLKKEVSLIIMGDKSNPGLLERLLFRSDTLDLIDDVNRPVILIPEYTTFKPIEKIAFATDSQAASKPVLDYLIEFASAFDAELKLIHVDDSPEPELKKINEEMFVNIRKQTNYAKIDSQTVNETAVTKALEKYAVETNVDILAMAQKKRSFFENLIHRSTTKEMMDMHSVPLLIFPKHFENPF